MPEVINLHIVGFGVLSVILVVIGFVKETKIETKSLVIVGALIIILIFWSLLMGRGGFWEVVLMEVKFRSSAYLMTLYSIFLALGFHLIRKK